MESVWDVRHINNSLNSSHSASAWDILRGEWEQCIFIVLYDVLGMYQVKSMWILLLDLVTAACRS